MVARLWGATTIRQAVLNRSTMALDAAGIKVVVVVEAQEEAMVDGTTILHPETVVAIQLRPQTGCLLLLEQWASVMACHRHLPPLISATAVDTVDTGAGITKAMATTEADMVRHQGSTMEEVVEEEAIKAIKARGTSSHRTLVVMTGDKEEGMEGTGAMIAAIVETVVAIVARSRYKSAAPVRALVDVIPQMRQMETSMGPQCCLLCHEGEICFTSTVLGNSYPLAVLPSRVVVYYAYSGQRSRVPV